MRSDVNNPSFVWGALRKVLPAGATDGTDNVRGLRLTADGHGAVFDLKEVSGRPLPPHCYGVNPLPLSSYGVELADPTPTPTAQAPPDSPPPPPTP